MTLLNILFAILSTASLVCMAVFIYLAERGNSSFLLSTSDHRRMLVKDKLFIGLAAVGVFVCIYQGAHAMLWWLPDGAGTADEDGHYRSTSSYFAVLFSLGFGYLLLSIIDSSTRNQVALMEVSTKAEELGKILDAKGKRYKLESLKSAYEKKIMELSLLVPEAKLVDAQRISIEEEMMHVYSDLLCAVECELKTCSAE